MGLFALGLADKFRLTLYDACYLELAQRRDLPLATLRQGFAQGREISRHPAVRYLTIAPPPAPSLRTTPCNAATLDRPGCRLYYEVDGTGPLLVFAHGLGGNHLSWWQQVPHFRDRYTCVTFAHRGFAPSSAPPGGPDPADYAGDLAALIDHLGAQRCAHRGAIDGRLERARLCARAAGARARAGAGLDGGPDRARARTVCRRRAIARMGAHGRGRRGHKLQEANIHVAAGERMAREQPAAHFLYQEIDALSRVDKVKLRRMLHETMVRPADALRTLNVPTLWLTGDEDIVYPPFLSEVLAKLMPNARRRAGRAGRALGLFRAAGGVQPDRG